MSTEPTKGEKRAHEEDPSQEGEPPQEHPRKKYKVNKSVSINAAEFDALPSEAKDGFFCIKNDKNTSRAFYSQGVKHGLSINTSDRDMEITDYDNGVPDGLNLHLYDNKSSHIHFSHYSQGKREKVSLNMMGQHPSYIITISQYNDDKHHETSVRIDDEKLTQTKEWKEGTLHGEVKIFNKQGVPDVLTTYAFGKHDGLSYTQTGRHNYSMGVLHGRQMNKGEEDFYYFEGQECTRDYFDIYKNALARELGLILSCDKQTVFSPQAINIVSSYLLPDNL